MTKALATTEPAQADAEYLARLGEKLEITDPGNTEERWEKVALHLNAAIKNTAIGGYHLLQLKAELPRGQFMAEVERRGIPHRRATEAMAVTRFLLRIATKMENSKVADSATLKKVMDLPKVKVAELVKLDPEVFAGEQAEIDIDDVSTMHIDDLRQNVRSFRVKKEADNTRIAQLEQENRTLKSHGLDQHAGAKFPASLVQLRGEVPALSQQTGLYVAAMASYIESFPGSADLGKDTPTRKKHIAEGARIIALHLVSVMGEAGRAYEQLQETLGDYLPAGKWTAEDMPLPLSREEVTALWRLHKVQVGQHQAGVAHREDARILSGEMKRGRGAPKKIAISSVPKKQRGRPHGSVAKKKRGAKK